MGGYSTACALSAVCMRFICALSVFCRDVGILYHILHIDCLGRKVYSYCDNIYILTYKVVFGFNNLCTTLFVISRLR